MAFPCCFYPGGCDEIKGEPDCEGEQGSQFLTWDCFAFKTRDEEEIRRRTCNDDCEDKDHQKDGFLRELTFVDNQRYRPDYEQNEDR